MEDPVADVENCVDPCRTDGETGLVIDQEIGMVQTEDPVAIIQVVEAIEREPEGEEVIVLVAEHDAVVPPLLPRQLQE